MINALIIGALVFGIGAILTLLALGDELVTIWRRSTVVMLVYGCNRRQAIRHIKELDMKK